MKDFDVIEVLDNYKFIIDRVQEIIKMATRDYRNVESLYIMYSFGIENDEPEFNSRHIVNINKPTRMVTAIRVIYRYADDDVDRAIEFPADWFFLSNEELADAVLRKEFG